MLVLAEAPPGAPHAGPRLRVTRLLLGSICRMPPRRPDAVAYHIRWAGGRPVGLALVRNSATGTSGEHRADQLLPGSGDPPPSNVAARPVRHRRPWPGRLRMGRRPRAGQAEVVADPAPRPDGIRGLALPVLLSLRGQPLPG